MSRTNGVALSPTLAILALPTLAAAQWSAEPGETTRNMFGAEQGGGRSPAVCRGACGAGCPDNCTQTVRFECVDSSRLRRITSFECGTHQACREHDDCLDTCTRGGMKKMECDAQCHAEAVESYGLEPAVSWLGGDGPYDGRITFEYTRDQPGSPEATYR